MTPNLMIHLDVEAMRYRVVHAFADHSREIEQEIDSALIAAFHDFDFMAIVRAEADRVLRESVKAAIVSACSSLMREEPIADMIKDGARAKVRAALEEALKD
jgi:methylase of polypeptide subunit release factors